MISPSPVFTSSLHVLDKHIENSALSPKRSFAQHDEDPTSQLELKRRQVLAHTQPARRVPLDPLSTSGSENRRNRASHSTASAEHRAIVTASSVSDLRVLLPKVPVSSGYCGMRRGGTSSASVCSWPPPTPALGPSGPPHSSLARDLVAQCPASPNWESSRATLLQSSTLTWQGPHCVRTEPATATSGHVRTTEDVLPPIPLRTCSMPSIPRPPEDLWRSDAGSTRAVHELIIDPATDVLVCSPPSTLSPPRPEPRRSNSDASLLSLGSLSLSLALGSQPLRVSEHTKAVPPIGAERNRAVSVMTSRRHSPTPHLSDPPQSLGCSPPHGDDARLLDTTLLGDVRTVTDVSRADLARLLRHAVQNKHAPKVISPLSPLRSATALSTDPEYQRRMPSPANSPSPRYAKCPSRRARTICDGYQSLDWETTCMHCQECKRDTVCKKLLAVRHRRQQPHHPRGKPHGLSFRGTPVMDDPERSVLANRIREAFAYEMDEEEKSLWEEVAAVTGAGGSVSTRAGAPSCAAVADRYVVDDGSHHTDDEDDGEDHHHQRHHHRVRPDEGLFASGESATLFRDVTVY